MLHRLRSVLVRRGRDRLAGMVEVGRLTSNGMPTTTGAFSSLC